jgi:predicted component of type VI protein secretion system
MEVVLTMFASDGHRRRYPINRDMTVIGRREDCDLRIPLSDVSRKHCRLVKEADTVRVEDLGSSNGTFRNGERVQEANLEAGDTIKVGPVNFVIQIDGAPADDDLKVYAEAPPTEPELEEISAGESPTVAEEAPEEFDPMAALAGSDSGLDMEGGGPGGSKGDSMQIDLGGSKTEDKA